MAITVEKLTREFTFEKNGRTITLQDPNADLSVDEVLDFYTGVHPELTTAVAQAPKTTGKKVSIHFKTTLGTKG